MGKLLGGRGRMIGVALSGALVGDIGVNSDASGPTCFLTSLLSLRDSKVCCDVKHRVL